MKLRQAKGASFAHSSTSAKDKIGGLESGRELGQEMREYKKRGVHSPTSPKLVLIKTFPCVGGSV
jgi:hypothetical protein